MCWDECIPNRRESLVEFSYIMCGDMHHFERCQILTHHAVKVPLMSCFSLVPNFVSVIALSSCSLAHKYHYMSNLPKSLLSTPSLTFLYPTNSSSSPFYPSTHPFHYSPSPPLLPFALILIQHPLKPLLSHVPPN